MAKHRWQCRIGAAKEECVHDNYQGPCITGKSWTGQGRRRGHHVQAWIQGLRSLAVLMVVSYHILFGRVSGGVDVFLLISAFLMTLQFVSRFEDARPVSLVRHWLHLFWRLLPAVVVVLLATLAATYLVIPRTRWLGDLQPRMGFPLRRPKLAASEAGGQLLRCRPQRGEPFSALLVAVHPGAGVHPVASHLCCRCLGLPPVWPAVSGGAAGSVRADIRSIAGLLGLFHGRTSGTGLFRYFCPAVGVCLGHPRGAVAPVSSAGRGVEACSGGLGWRPC